MKTFWTLLVCSVIQAFFVTQGQDLRQEDIDNVFNQQPGQDRDELDFVDGSIDESINIPPREREADPPFDENLNSISDEDTLPERPSFNNRQDGDDPVAVIQVSGKSVTGDDDYSVPDEDMDTAETIVFRPLFRYRKKSIAKKRVFKDSTGQAYAKPTFVYDAPATHRRNPPAILVYDRGTGGYYPVKGYNY